MQDEPTNGTVYYGLDSSYGNIVIDYTSEYVLGTFHTVTIYDFETGKSYHYKIVSWNEVGLKGESPDDKFLIPRDKYLQSQYNGLRTIIYGNVQGTTLGSKVDLTIFCYDKAVAITPDTIVVTSATSEQEITVNPTSSSKSRATGMYTGTYTLTQADLDAAGITDPNLLEIYTYNTATLSWEKIPVTSVDKENLFVVCQVNHFSLYTLGFASGGDQNQQTSPKDTCFISILK